MISLKTKEIDFSNNETYFNQKVNIWILNFQKYYKRKEIIEKYCNNLVGLVRLNN